MSFATHQVSSSAASAPLSFLQRAQRHDEKPAEKEEEEEEDEDREHDITDVLSSGVFREAAKTFEAWSKASETGST